ncbi:MAG: Holliday junction branch migration protein RuvA [Legionellales bacterium]|nr:Holliday junction branch migration protein RuvA [Legionellales bacterium]OUX63768.1 MAG: Holliday junction branch migration protein RuvA [Gammaproteobacteria bacterium TMED281]
MIHQITGKITYVSPPYIYSDVAGIGYEIECSQKCIDFATPGQVVNIFTHLVVREDAHSLYGFKTLQERDLFRILIKVSGVGPKMALAIISGLSVSDIVQAVMLKNSVPFLSCKGVGKRLAEKLIVECQNKLNSWEYQIEEDASSDAISALMNLGYKKHDVQQLCQQASRLGITETSSIIKYVLGELQPA